MKSYETLFKEMGEFYLQDPAYAVRSKKFIGMLEEHLASEITSQLSEYANSQGLKVFNEKKIFQDYKVKNVDIALIDPINGPLITIGVRSQMSDIAKNVLTYYQEISGECLHLQNRYPMSTHGYVYIHPKKLIGDKKENIDHDRYAKLFSSIGCRTEASKVDYSLIKGNFDHFAYPVIDFKSKPVTFFDDWKNKLNLTNDISIKNFVKNIIKTSKERLNFIDYFI